MLLEADVEPDRRVERRDLVQQDVRSSASKAPSAIVPATLPTIWRTEDSRSGKPTWPRKYFWLTMFVAFCDHAAPPSG